MVKKIPILNVRLPKSKPDSKYIYPLRLFGKMTPTEIQEKEILKEYYSFLYDLATKKKYLHASQLTEEERKYCEKLLGSCKTKLKSNELYLPLMENILRNHYSETSD